MRLLQMIVVCNEAPMQGDYLMDIANQAIERHGSIRDALITFSWLALADKASIN